MYVLENVVQPYSWGSRTAIAELAGRSSPSAQPEAELWMGAHPSAPSRVRSGDGTLSLADAVSFDPGRWLGAETIARFGPKLPFLFKVLAADAPLSLQAHPDPEQARRGFADEEAAGVPRDAGHRNYKDASAKPEVLCALGPFEALLGFRTLADTRRLLAALSVPALDPHLDDLATGPSGLQRAFERLMRTPRAARRELVADTERACLRLHDAHHEFAREYAWGARLAQAYPDDVGVVVALMLNLVELGAGEAIYVPAGRLHAYLRGAGVELMASSDNVLRGGLTSKHVDVGELTRILCFDDERPQRVPCRRDGAEQIYLTPASEFRLSRIALADGERWRASRRWGPEILLVVEGQARLRGQDGAPMTAARGVSLFVPPTSGAYELAGPAVVFRASVGSPEPESAAHSEG